MRTKQTVEQLDAGLRHKVGIKPSDFERYYCELIAEYSCYATRDGNWNELEKTLTDVVGEVIYLRRFLDIAGFDLEEFDLRELVKQYEALEETQADTEKHMQSLLACTKVHNA